MESGLTCTSFMRTAPPQSGSMRMISRSRDHLTGGAQYSGRCCQQKITATNPLPTRVSNLECGKKRNFTQVGLISGTVFVILGLAVLAVGFLVPTKIEAFGEADFVVVDTHAVQFNGALDMCKLAGAILFCIGGTSMAGCLLMSVFAKSYSKEEKFLQQKFKEQIADIKAHTQPITKAPGPGETKIPVTLSRVQNVQPVLAT